MRNNLLLEINNMKRLMGINESSDAECENQLELAGYRVYSPSELRDIDEGCEEKTNIKCVIEWLNDNGIDSSRYRVGKYRSLCYLLVQSEDTVNQSGKTLNKKNWTFWDNGDVTVILSFTNLQIDPDDTNKKYSQAQYKGKYDCNGSDFSWSDLRFEGVYEFKKYDDLEKVDNSFQVTKPDGTKILIANLVDTDSTFASYNFN